MQIAQTRAELAVILDSWQNAGLQWAFVPTMGALHEGHLTLVRKALRTYPRVVVSIFVNPTQFDRSDDLDKYPRQPEQDADLLKATGAHLLFLPTLETVYPDGTADTRTPDLAGLDTKYEGAARPGHFDGVVQVVRELIKLVRPEAMFMGQKDAQQVAVLRRAAAQEFWPVTIYVVPTVREDSGLAMSSRNGQLSEAGFAKAAQIHECLNTAASAWHRGGLPRALEASAKTKLNRAGFKVEYFDFIDAKNFTPLQDLPKGEQANNISPLIITVAWVDGVRLIDNFPLEAASTQG